MARRRKIHFSLWILKKVLRRAKREEYLNFNFIWEVGRKPSILFFLKAFYTYFSEHTNICVILPNGTFLPVTAKLFYPLTHFATYP